MKVAIIHYWLTNMRGGEKVLEQLCLLYPQADIFTHAYDPEKVSDLINSHNVRCTFINSLPLAKKHCQKYLPLMPMALKKLDLNGYDLIISSESGPAKGVRKPKDAIHICYCHTPMRYLWDLYQEYYKTAGIAGKMAMRLFKNYLRRYDLWSAEQVDFFIANSRFVADRIKRIYGKASTVIHPPVDCDRFALCNEDDGYYLVLSALVPYKKVDIAVGAFNETDKKLLVIGNGPELDRLKRMASSNIEFIETADDEQVASYLQRCRALLFPGKEDFGIVPLEAQACGKPVIAFAGGGALETVVGIDSIKAGASNATGVFFQEQNCKALLDAVEFFEEKKKLVNSENCRQNALKFDSSIYKRSMKNYIESVASNRLS